jgi:hypothetical protein
MTDFAIAVGSTDVTPRFPPWPSLWMGGYGWGRRANRGAVAHDLMAHCAVLHDGGTPKVIVRVDTVMIPREVHQSIRQRVLDEGLVGKSADFFISISHTHSGPFLGDTNPDPFVMIDVDQPDIDAINITTGMFADLIVQLVRDTVAQDPTPVTLGYAVGSTAFAFNRADQDTLLTDVPVLLATAKDTGDPVAVLFGYACHPVSRGNDTTFDSDYVGCAAEAITAQRGIPALFLQGAAGDHDPVGDRGPDRPVQLGDQLAAAVFDVLDNGDFAPVTGPVETRMVEVELPYAVDIDDPAARGELAGKYLERVRETPPNLVINRHGQVMLRQLGAGDLAPTIPMPIQRWRFGGLTILALAHEVVSGYDAAIKRLAGGPTWVLGYANEISGYIPSDALLWAGGKLHGGYEAGWLDDPNITGDGTSMMAFTWPAPLRSSPEGTSPPVAGSAERIVLDACRDLLRP